MTRAITVYLAALLSASILLPACGGGPDTPVVVRDSAGVAITLSHAPAWAADAGWLVEAEPTLIVGGLVGQRPFEFTTVGDARILDDGYLLVTHCSNPPELRLYAGDGGFLHTLGGQGQGAGQCNFILHSWMAGDTAILYDPSLARITYFDISGGEPRVLDLDAAGLGDVERGDPMWVDRFDDGAFLGRPNGSDPVENGRTRAPIPYVRLDPADLSVDTLFQVRGTEYVAEGLGTPEEDIRPVLFSPFTHAVAHGGHVYLADSGEFWIEERTIDGAVVRRFGRGWEPSGIGRGFRRDYAEQRVAAAPRSHIAATRREMARAIFADHFPVHEGQLAFDPDGNLWVHHLRVPGDTIRTWSVFNPEGRWLGEVHVPASLQVTDIGADYVLGVWRDDEGVQSIRRFPLVKPTVP